MPALEFPGRRPAFANPTVLARPTYPQHFRSPPPPVIRPTSHLHREFLVWSGVAALLLTAILLPFWWWGAQLDALLSLERLREQITPWGFWAGAAGMSLLLADLFLPIPGTVVMSALGLTLGPWWGAFWGGSGSFLAGMLGYGLSRWIGRPAALWIAGPSGLQRGERLFATNGFWLILCSRWMPILPEALSCLAGLARMPLKTFSFALACGSFSTGLVFASLGAWGREHSGGALAGNLLLPLLLWGLSRRWLRN